MFLASRMASAPTSTARSTTAVSVEKKNRLTRFPDTAVVLRAVEVGADAILLAKNIDGVYTDDPKKNPDATLIREISYEKAQEMRLKVMDAAAFALCAENKVPVVRVFGLFKPESIIDVLDGDDMGTVLRPEK